MIHLTYAEAKYIVERLRECYDALKESPKLDRTELEFAIHLLIDNPGYNLPTNLKLQRLVEREK